VPPGTHTVVVQQTGYATVTLTEVVVAAGNTTNLGSIALATDPMTATLRGKVTDGASGAPLPGATLTLAGDATGAATTDARGDYQFTGLPPGGVTITVAKVGYATVTVTATATLAGGGMGFFSPSLYAAGAEPTTATLLGRVVDASDGQPLSGATHGGGAGPDGQHGRRRGIHPGGPPRRGLLRHRQRGRP
jgi:protocatechuate 3,4-dioxygenase beta subunit